MFDLFLRVYDILADNSLTVVNFPGSEENEIWKESEDFWRSHFEKSDDSRIVEDGNFREQTERLLEQRVPGWSQSLGSDSQRSVPLLAEFLRALEEPLARYLESHNKFIYPLSPLNNGPTIVRKTQRYFSSFRKERDKPPPQGGQKTDRQFTQALGLGNLYVVPRLQADDVFSWDIYPFPDRLRNQLDLPKRLDLLASHKIGLLSFPHCQNDIHVEVDENRLRFHVPGYDNKETEARIIDAVGKAVAHAGDARVIFLICPELTGSDALRTRISEVLAVNHSVIIACPGSEHLQVESKRRNRCTILGPGGEKIESWHHDKLSPFPLPKEALKQLGHTALADSQANVEEDIDRPRRIVLWDIPGLGRIAVLICLDILTESVQHFLRRHEVDHILVPAMSPTLQKFVDECSDLGRSLDAGIYVVNSCHWGNQKQKCDAAYVYLPYRDPAKRDFLCSCKPNPKRGHLVCLRILDVKKPGIGRPVRV
jgi:predicted amidohydrolase